MIYILLFISGAAKGVMDTLQFHFDRSIFKGINNLYWNPEISWVRKYEGTDSSIRRKWLGVPIPVAFTDAFHLFQSIFLTTLFIAIVLYRPITSYKVVDFILLRSIFGFSFVLFYNKLLIKK
jgi:hypothetical protein